jgi:hypothetical protein
MAQTLLYLDQALAGIPDNSQQLIVPENIRDFMVSQAQGKGFLEHTDNIALIITDGVWLQINPVLTNPSTAQILWSFDGNNLAFPSYSIDLTDTTVPPGYTKLASVVAVLELTKALGGADNYEVSFTKNGATFGQPESVEFSAAGTQTVTILHAFLTDVSITTDTFGVQIQGVGTSDNLTLGYFTQQMSDSMLLATPAP